MPRHNVKVRKTPQTNVSDLEVCNWSGDVRMQGYATRERGNWTEFMSIRLCGVTNLRRLYNEIGRVLREVE